MLWWHYNPQLCTGIQLCQVLADLTRHSGGGGGQTAAESCCTRCRRRGSGGLVLGQLRAGGGRDLLLPPHRPSLLQEQPWSVYGAAAPRGWSWHPKVLVFPPSSLPAHRSRGRSVGLQQPSSPGWSGKNLQKIIERNLKLPNAFVCFFIRNPYSIRFSWHREL